MNAILILADAAVGHPDNTFSLLRGGITQLRVPSTAPPRFKGALVGRMEASTKEAGGHRFEIRCLDSAGQGIMTPLEGDFSTAAEGGAINLILDVQLIFPRADHFRFELSVDRLRIATWPLQVVQG